MIVYERRACTVLYNLLVSCEAAGPILLPANVCPIVPLTLLKARQRFEFIDISPTTLCIDHERVLERWLTGSDRPSGLIYVRTYGAIFDTNALFQDIKDLSPSALIVDDRCACCPLFDTNSTSNNADAVLYSTGYAKYSDIGQGGFALLGDKISYKRTNLPFDKNSLAFQMLQANNAIADQKKFIYSDNDWLDFSEPSNDWVTYCEMVESRISNVSPLKRLINNIYTSVLPQEIQLEEPFQGWRFNIHVSDKPGLLAAISAAGIFASGHYASLDNIFGNGSGLNARFLHKHVINLFNDLYFDVDKAELISGIIRNFNGLAPSALKI